MPLETLHKLQPKKGAADTGQKCLPFLLALTRGIAGIPKSCQSLLEGHIRPQQLSLPQHMQNCTQRSSRGCPYQLPLAAPAAIQDVPTAVSTTLLRPICKAAGLYSCSAELNSALYTLCSAGCGDADAAQLITCVLEEEGLQGWGGRV